MGDWRRTDAGLVDWINGLLESKGRSKVDLARALQIDASSISRILSGSRRVRNSELRAMSLFFDTPAPDQDTSHGINGGINVVRKIPVLANAETGVWYEPNILDTDVQDERHSPVPTVTDPRFSSMNQFAVRVSDDSVNLEMAPGNYAIYVPYWDARKAIQQLDWAIVHRMQDGKTEFTIRQICHPKDHWTLEPKSSNQRWKNSAIALSEDLQHELDHPGIAVSLAGLIIWVGKPMQ